MSWRNSSGSAIRLGQRYVKTIRRRDGFYGGWLRSIPRLQARIADRTDRQQKWLRASLYKKYENIMKEVFEFSSLCTRSIEAYESFVANSWVRLDHRLRQNPVPHFFAATLWQAVLEDEIDGPRADVLKPKFMLRQFVDEIDNRNTRDLFLNEAFHGVGAILPPDIITLSALSNGYPILREAVLRYQGELAALTADGLLRIDREDFDLNTMEIWLFPRS